jgi:hypothetical protein
MRSGWIFHSKESRNKVAAKWDVFFSGVAILSNSIRFAKPTLFLTHAAIDKIRVRQSRASSRLLARHLDAKILKPVYQFCFPMK